MVLKREIFYVLFLDAIRIPTVSFSDTHQNTSALQEFDHLLKRGLTFLQSGHRAKPNIIQVNNHLRLFLVTWDLTNYKLTLIYLTLSVFPTIFSSSLVKHEMVGNYSHLFTVSGTDPKLVPYMLLAHIDVVPANETDGWEVPPFSASELNGFIYGRGTIDNKQSVMV